MNGAVTKLAKTRVPVPSSTASNITTFFSRNFKLAVTTFKGNTNKASSWSGHIGTSHTTMAKFQTSNPSDAVLEELNFHAPKPTSKLRLLKLLNRAERGFSSYNRLNAPHLRRMAKPRGVTATLGNSVKEKVIQLLETADERHAHATFERFASLPPELRVRIYELYFESLGIISCPSQPPISRVSRMLRMESLPIFFQTCRINVEVDLAEPFAKKFDDVLVPYQLTKRFFESLPNNHLGWIQRLRLDTATLLNGEFTRETV